MSQLRQLAAIMFTDIVGYTSLMGNDEQRAFELLKKNREIHKPIIEEFGGKWIKEIGDGVMASFPAVSNAVYAAMKIQEACHQANEFELRIGIHQGEVILENDDIFGDAVNIAARIQTLAYPSSIFISESVQSNLQNKSDIKFEFFKVENLKNVREPIKVFKVILPGIVTKTEQTQKLKKSSIVQDCDVDIQISFRDNDNNYDGWVSGFVEKLKQELGATCKDKLSIFFDKNPEDRKKKFQLEDGTISSEIKPLIFIPIISQTYCDTNSSIWNDEFQTFKKQVKRDGIGANVKFPNGNSVSRVIPVKIHEIDIEDVKLLEKELEGSLRSIDFIFKAEGVNRPLLPIDDSEPGNQLRPMYRNQINKLANAIKELISGVKFSQNEQSFGYSAFSPTATKIAPKVVSTSISSGLKIQMVDGLRPNIFLAWTSNDLKEKREEMAIVLKKAGFNVLPAIDCPADDETFKHRVQENLKQCMCSLHILSGEFGRRFEIEDEVSFPQFQFMEAKKILDESGSNFQSFVWVHPEASSSMKPSQQEFIKYIRNNITRNMMFSNSAGPMQLVDDIRVVMMKEEEEIYDSKDTDIFFIFNQQDELEARDITDRLSMEFPIEIMNIMPDGEEEYREVSTQQIPKSKLAVVYFKYAADWALPFIKQIWKQVGGASSPTPLFFVGEDDPKSNLARNFKAPKVVSTIVPKEEIPTEVKKVYTTVVKFK